MKSRDILTLHAAAAAILLSACREARAASGPANLVLVSFDTLRADHVSCYGYGRRTTPVIDELARDGVLFSSAYSHSNKTGPSHMSILTGLLPEAHGVRNLAETDNRRLAEGVPTLATWMRDSGWRTAAFTGGGHVSAALGFDAGFEVFEAGGGVKGVLDKGAEFAEAHGAEPFFLFLHTYEVHDPYVPPKGFREIWTDEDYSGAIVSSRQELKALSGEAWDTQHEAFWERVDDGSEADRAHLVGLYDGSIKYADKQLGEFLDRLDSLGELEDTLIVFLSDHGEEFREHDGWLHETVYQELLHVPLVIRPAEGMLTASRGIRIDPVVRLVDVLPTILELLDLPLPERLQGESLVPLVLEQEPPKAFVLSQWPREGLHALRSGDWKLVARLSADGRPERVELYDLSADPREQVDLAAREPARVDELMSEMRELFASSASFGITGSGDVALTSGLREQLGDLGYLDGAGAEAAESEHGASRAATDDARDADER